MKKKLVRLTEGDLHRIIKESVNKILREFNSYEDEMDLNVYNKMLKKYDLDDMSMPFNGVCVVSRRNYCNLMDEQGNILLPNVWFDDIDSCEFEKYGSITCELDGETYSFDNIEELIHYFRQ